MISCFECNYKYEWNSHQILLVGDKFMPEMRLKQPGVTYSACGTFTRNKERIKNLKKQEILNFFDKKNAGSVVNNKIKKNEQLAKELHKTIMKKKKKLKKKSLFFI